MLSWSRDPRGDIRSGCCYATTEGAGGVRSRSGDHAWPKDAGEEADLNFENLYVIAKGWTGQSPLKEYGDGLCNLT